MRERRTPHMTTSEAARALGVSRQTLHNWIRTGKVPEPGRNPVTRYLRWTPEDVDRVRNAIQEVRLR